MYNKTKPLIRWIIGPCHELGFDCLNESVRRFNKLYGSLFFKTICYNQLNTKQINKLPKHLVDQIIDQNKFSKDLKISPPLKKAGTAWKLYPPRLSLNTHEIIIDNDLIIYKNLEEIEEFLKNKDQFLITEGYRRSYNKTFDKNIKSNFIINSGFVGLPPFFDYKKEIDNILDINKKWENHFDEQSIVANILQNKKTKIINLNKISINGYNTGNFNGECGTHFNGINQGFNTRWMEFLMVKLC